MSKDAPGRLRPHDQLREARQILDTEGKRREASFCVADPALVLTP